MMAMPVAGLHGMAMDFEFHGRAILAAAANGVAQLGSMSALTLSSCRSTLSPVFRHDHGLNGERGIDDVRRGRPSMRANSGFMIAKLGHLNDVDACQSLSDQA